MTPVFKPGTNFSYISCTKSQLPKTSMRGHYTVTNLASGACHSCLIIRHPQHWFNQTFILVVLIRHSLRLNIFISTMRSGALILSSWFCTHASSELKDILGWQIRVGMIKLDKCCRIKLQRNNSWVSHGCWTICNTGRLLKIFSIEFRMELILWKILVHLSLNLFSFLKSYAYFSCFFET